MRSLTFPLFLALLLLTGCKSDTTTADEQWKELQREQDVKLAALKWENAQVTAARLWCRSPEGWGTMTVGEVMGLDSCQRQHEFATFVKCHDEPPTKEANKKLCASLQAQVEKADARWTKQAEEEKKNW